MFIRTTQDLRAARDPGTALNSRIGGDDRSQSGLGVSMPMQVFLDAPVEHLRGWAEGSRKSEGEEGSPKSRCYSVLYESE